MTASALASAIPWLVMIQTHHLVLCDPGTPPHAHTHRTSLAGRPSSCVNHAAASSPSSAAVPVKSHTVTVRRADGGTGAAGSVRGTCSAGMPAVDSSSAAPGASLPHASPSKASGGRLTATWQSLDSWRCVMKRPVSAETTIQWRSYSKPVGATRALSSGMGRQPLTGNTRKDTTRVICDERCTANHRCRWPCAAGFVQGRVLMDSSTVKLQLAQRNKRITVVKYMVFEFLYLTLSGSAASTSRACIACRHRQFFSSHHQHNTTGMQ